MVGFNWRYFFVKWDMSMRHLCSACYIYSKCINYSRLVWKKKRLVLKCCYVIKLCSVFSDSNVNIESIYLINTQFPVQSNSICHWKLLCIANFSFPFGRILISLIMNGNNSFENESVRDKMKRRCFTSFFYVPKV